MSYIIRPATIDDAAGIAQVHVSSWQTTYQGIMPDEMLQSLDVTQREARWARILSEPAVASITVVAEEAGQIVGFASGGREQSGQHPEMAEVYAIYLLAEHQRRGIGRALMIPTIQHLMREGFGTMLIWVAAENPSRAFYEALGGTAFGDKSESFGGKVIREISYRWDDLPGLLAQLQSKTPSP
jgi:GNAT superfamily N-acetyltransferase